MALKGTTRGFMKFSNIGNNEVPGEAAEIRRDPRPSQASVRGNVRGNVLTGPGGLGRV